MKLPWRHRASSHGQSMVEFALILPLFVLFLVIAIDFGRVFFSYIQVTNAAREGAAFGALKPTDDIGIANRVRQETNAQGQSGESAVVVASACKDVAGSALACSLATGGAGPGNTITVTVSEQFSFLTPLVNTFFQNNFVMRSGATSTVLGYAASSGGNPTGNCPSPVPTFTPVVTSGLIVHVDPTGSTPNSGVCNISGYNWTWGDGSDSVGTATGEDHPYLVAGTYSITLETTNQGGPATTSRTVTVPVGPPVSTCAKPIADFTWTSSGKTYTYLDRSSVPDPLNCPITDWLWTFTDVGGSQSNAPNPAPQTYGNNSSHPVTLKVTNAGGSTTITRNG